MTDDFIEFVHYHRKILAFAAVTPDLRNIFFYKEDQRKKCIYLASRISISCKIIFSKSCPLRGKYRKLMVNGIIESCFFSTDLFTMELSCFNCATAVTLYNYYDMQVIFCRCYR